MTTRQTRREFLKMAALSTASLGLPGGTGPDLIGVAQAWP